MEYFPTNVPLDAGIWQFFRRFYAEAGVECCGNCPGRVLKALTTGKGE